jgi:HK97 family phage major capsid protein
MVEKLKEKRVALIDEMEKLIEGKEQLTDEERTQYDALEKQVETLDGDIERAEKLAKRKADDKKILDDLPPPVLDTKDTSDKDERDLKTFSYRKLILGAMSNSLEGLEKEMNEEGKKEQRDGGIMPDDMAVAVPSIIHSRDTLDGTKYPKGRQTRATLQATVDAAGGYAVAEDTMGLIETLRNKFAVGRAGATIMNGLVGDVKFPRRATDSVAKWRSEGGTATQSDPTYEALTLSPNRLTGYSEFSRQFLRQSSFAVEAEVKNTLMYAHMNALELAVFTGSGTSNQPTGLFASSINDGDHGSNGTVLNWDNIIQLERMVAEDNALEGSLAYITNAKAAGLMKKTLKTTYQGGFIWEMFTPLTDGMINGYDAYISNVIPSTLTRGTGTGLSAVVFGNWKELIIGQWGAIEFIVNPYSLDTTDEIRVTGVGYFDLGLKHAESFAAIEGLKTT